MLMLFYSLLFMQTLSKMLKRTNLTSTFFRYNIVAITASGVDLMLLILLTEIAGLWYLISAIIASVSGGIVAFILERHWTFKKKDNEIIKQVYKYILIWLFSIFLNIRLLYLFVDSFGVQYIISKVIVAVLVGIGFNFITHKYYIFK